MCLSNAVLFALLIYVFARFDLSTAVLNAVKSSCSFSLLRGSIPGPVVAMVGPVIFKSQNFPYCLPLLHEGLAGNFVYSDVRNSVCYSGYMQ